MALHAEWLMAHDLMHVIVVIDVTLMRVRAKLRNDLKFHCKLNRSKMLKVLTVKM